MSHSNIRQNVTQKIQIIQNINSFGHLKGNKPLRIHCTTSHLFLSYLCLLQDITETFTNSYQSSYPKASYPPMSLTQSLAWFCLACFALGRNAPRCSLIDCTIPTSSNHLVVNALDLSLFFFFPQRHSFNLIMVPKHMIRVL